MPAGSSTIPEKLAKFRELMKKNQVDAYLVPSTDPHKSEYLPVCWQRRQWLSGFTGSAGDLVVTRDWAGLWTDSRYFLQAGEQLAGSGIELMKLGLAETPAIEDWLADNLKKGQRFGVDPCLMMPGDEGRFKKRLAKKGVDLVYIDSNLVDLIWKDQPSKPLDPVKVLPKKYAGESVEQKLARVREKMTEAGASVHVISALDRIAWLFNLRGSDVEYNPVFIAYAVVTDKDATIYIDQKKVSKSVRNSLKGTARFKPYGSIAADLKAVSKRAVKVWIDPTTVNMWIIHLLGNRVKLVKQRSPATDFKAEKNPVELQGMRDAHVQDGLAMVRFLKWLEENVKKGSVTEISAAAKVDRLRERGHLFVGPSFTTISGYAGHGAIVHYDVDKESNVKLQPKGIYLNDSGGQYQNGTTDITRTVSLGSPTKDEIKMFTRVLKGHIQIASVRWPKGFSGKQIEVLARKALWDIGENYGHGTGHGIGHYLNVHEGPMGITPRDTGITLKPGMVLSNEPGFYKAGKYGIRTENVIVVVKDEEFSSDEGEWLRFETITLCPIDLTLIDPDLLTREELKWLNDYHKRVYDMLGPLLNRGERAWLKKKTKRIGFRKK